jgi:hypothetical protein
MNILLHSFTSITTLNLYSKHIRCPNYLRLDLHSIITSIIIFKKGRRSNLILSTRYMPHFSLHTLYTQHNSLHNLMLKLSFLVCFMTESEIYDDPVTFHKQFSLHNFRISDVAGEWSRYWLADTYHSMSKILIKTRQVCKK